MHWFRNQQLPSCTLRAPNSVASDDGLRIGPERRLPPHSINRKPARSGKVSGPRCNFRARTAGEARSESDFDQAFPLVALTVGADQQILLPHGPLKGCITEALNESRGCNRRNRGQQRA